MRLGSLSGAEALAKPPAIEAARVVTDLDARHGQALLGFARRIGLNDEEAEDAVQEVCLRLFRVIQDGTSVLDGRAWAFTALYRIAMDQHRLRRRIAGLLRVMGRGTEWGRPGEVDHARRISIWTEVDRLPDRQRLVLYLHYKADLGFEQTAEVMGITAAGARAVAARAIATLRKTIDGRTLDHD